jgi:hypothetical protein
MGAERMLVVYVMSALVFIAGMSVAGMFGFKHYKRYQKVMDAQNEIYVNEMKIKQTEQLVQVENQKAEVRIAEAKGIAESQRLINASLTDKYLQHEAIKAQENMANSPNHTQIYIPVGQNGIPIVKTAD